VAKRHGLKQTGLRNLAGIFLGCRVPKGAKTTNWASPRLTEQIKGLRRSIAAFQTVRAAS
jgi:ribonuclease D